MIANDAAEAVRSFILDKFDKLESGVRFCNLGTDHLENQYLTLEKILGFTHAFRELILVNAEREELLKVSRLSKYIKSQFCAG